MSDVLNHSGRSHRRRLLSRLFKHLFLPHIFAILVGLFVVITLISQALPVAYAAGPGVPAITFTSTELFKPLYKFTSTNGNAPGFHGAAFMHDGYMVIPRAGTCCSGG